MGVEAVAVVEVEDRIQVAGLDSFDPLGGGFGVAAAEAGGLETALDQVELGVLTGASDCQALLTERR